MPLLEPLHLSPVNSIEQKKSLLTSQIKGGNDQVSVMTQERCKLNNYDLLVRKFGGK